MSACADGSCNRPAAKVADTRPVPPYVDALPSAHPCWERNALLGRCDAAQPRGEMLGVRAIRCAEERKALMVCFTKHKRSDPIAPAATSGTPASESC